MLSPSHDARNWVISNWLISIKGVYGLASRCILTSQFCRINASFLRWSSCEVRVSIYLVRDLCSSKISLVRDSVSTRSHLRLMWIHFHDLCSNGRICGKPLSSVNRSRHSGFEIGIEIVGLWQFNLVGVLDNLDRLVAVISALKCMITKIMSII